MGLGFALHVLLISVFFGWRFRLRFAAYPPVVKGEVVKNPTSGAKQAAEKLWILG